MINKNYLQLYENEVYNLKGNNIKVHSVDTVILNNEKSNLLEGILLDYNHKEIYFENTPIEYLIVFSKE